MSVVTETVDDVRLERIPARLALYEGLIQAAEPLFEIKGRSLQEVCAEHPSNLMMYDVMLQECRTIEETVKSKIEELESTITQRYQANSQVQLKVTELRVYVRGDAQLNRAIEILLEVQHIKRQLDAVVEALRSLGWSLNNIVKLRVAQLDDNI